MNIEKKYLELLPHLHERIKPGDKPLGERTYWSWQEYNDYPLHSGWRKESILSYPALVWDLDFSEGIHKNTKNPTRSYWEQHPYDTWITPPTFVIDTIGGHHLYWVLEEPLEKNYAEEIVIPAWKNVSNKFFKLRGLNIDQGPLNCAGLLRPPGLQRPKYNYKETFECYWSGELYGQQLINTLLRNTNQAKAEKKLIDTTLPELGGWLLRHGNRKCKIDFGDHKELINELQPGARYNTIPRIIGWLARYKEQIHQDCAEQLLANLDFGEHSNYAEQLISKHL